ncbi:MAG: hypothetical protein JW741_18345 [Sedimentisphaerales bacterium]|nr:hypothetical protein [Sedimentisphaerales bacterium]
MTALHCTCLNPKTPSLTRSQIGRPRISRSFLLPSVFTHRLRDGKNHIYFRSGGDRSAAWQPPPLPAPENVRVREFLDRIEAHLVVSFLAYCLFAARRNLLRPSAAGLTWRAVIEAFSQMQICLTCRSDIGKIRLSD